MAGKGYPQRKAGGALPKPTGWDSPTYWPDNDNRPRVKPHTRPPGVFPKGVPIGRKPFGRKPGIVYSPSFPRSFPRLGPWAGLGIAAAGWILYKPADMAAALEAAGYMKCCGSGGGDVYTFTAPIVSWGCSSEGFERCGITFQPYQGAWPAEVPSVAGGYGSRLLIGKKYGDTPENPGPTDRCTWMEHWVRPHIPGNDTLPGVPIPAPVVIPTTPDFWLPWDPNWWAPLDPTPYNPNWPAAPPRPYPNRPPRQWPRTYPESETGPYPGPTTRVIPEGWPTTTTVTTSNPFPEIRVDPGRPVKPDWPTTERKYSVRRTPYALLATRLLQLAAGTYGGITEVVDLVSAIYSAIPAEILAKYPDGLAKKDLLPFMLGAIYANRNVIDWQEAVHNIAVNQIEDYAWGKYFKAVDDVSRNGPYYQGFDRELGALNELFQQVLPK